MDYSIFYPHRCIDVKNQGIPWLWLFLSPEDTVKWEVTLNSRATFNSHTFSMETHGIVSITAMSQGVCYLDWSLKVSCPHPPTFLNAPTTFDLLICLNDNFQTRKFDALRRSFDRKLISPNMPRDTQKHLFGLCFLQIFTVLVGKIWGKLR